MKSGLRDYVWIHEENIRLARVYTLIGSPSGSVVAPRGVDGVLLKSFCPSILTGLEVCHLAWL